MKAATFIDEDGRQEMENQLHLSNCSVTATWKLQGCLCLSSLSLGVFASLVYSWKCVFTFRALHHHGAL